MNSKSTRPGWHKHDKGLKKKKAYLSMLADVPWLWIDVLARADGYFVAVP